MNLKCKIEKYVMIILTLCFLPCELKGYITDLNHDTLTNLSDLSSIASNWHSDTRPQYAGFCGDVNHPEPAGDINGDCIVNMEDLQVFVMDWLAENPLLTGTERLSTLKDSHFKSEDHEWANWVVTTASPTRIHFTSWTDTQRQAFLDDYCPDHIDEWAGPSVNRGDFCTMRGIAANTTHEYGANEDLNELRNHSTSVMLDNGICRKMNGQLANGGWDGSFLMCHNAPKWMELAWQSSGRQSVYGDSIFHDKLGTMLSEMDQGFCPWCNRRFIDYMTTYFTPTQLAAWGFDPDTFDLTTHLIAQKQIRNAEQLLEEPIIHEYIRFQWRDHLFALTSIVDNYHQNAAKAGRPIPAFFGNLESNSGLRPTPAAMSAITDIVWSEQSHAYQRPLDPAIQAYSTLLWKLQRAASHYRKATWSIQYQAAPPEVWPYGFGADKKYPTALTLAEASANGGVICQSWSATPFYNQSISETLLEGHRHHAKFVTQNRGLFVDRTSVVYHALVYSMPSVFWRFCYKLTVSRPHITHYAAAGRLLEDSHIPYNVVMLGHKDVFDDTKDLASLEKYNTIILPHADCISDRQADRIKQCVRAGAKLVLWAAENVGTRDEELAVRPAPVFADLIANPGSGVVEQIGTAQAAQYIETGQAGTLTAQVAGTGNPVVQTTLPETVWFCLWKHGAGPMMSLQMFNNDIDVESDTYTPVTNFTVTLSEPDGVDFTGVHYYNTGYTGTPQTAPTPLAFTHSGDAIVVTVPQLDMFGILVFSVDNELSARMTAAATRNAYEKVKIALRCPGQNSANYAALLADSKTLLNQIQGDVRVTDFASLIPLLQSQNTQLQTALNTITTTQQNILSNAANAAANITAYKKFDFGESGTPSGWTQVTSTTEYTTTLGYGWQEGQMEPGTVQRTETFSGDPEFAFPDDMDLRDWIYGNYDSDWGTDLSQASFNQAGQLLLKSNKKEASQSLTYNVFADVTNWEMEVTFKPLGPAGGGFFLINASNGAASYGRFQVYFGKDGGADLKVLGGSSGWTVLNTLNLGTMPNSVTVRLAWNNTTKKIGAYYGINGAAAATTLLPAYPQGYTQGTPVGNTQLMLRNMEWGLGTTSTPGNYTYEILLDHWTFEGDLRPTVGTAVNRGNPDTLHRDFIRSKDPIDYASGYTGNSHFPYTEPPVNPGDFKVNLPNGEYFVTVITGDWSEFRTATGGPSNEGRTAMTAVEAEGIPVLYGDRLESGYFQNRCFRTIITDGQLNLRFSGAFVGPLYCNPIEWLVNAVIIQTPVQTLTPAAQAYLAKADLLSGSAIRNWSVIGPFDDDDCRGLEILYGPEQSADTGLTYEGKNGTVAWQTLPALGGGAPAVLLQNYFADVNETAGFALSHVYCPSDMQAVLVCSISQLGVVYVNHQPVFTDRLAIGLVPDEQYIPISLHSGWNSIMIKTLNHWGTAWSLWAGLLTENRQQPLMTQPGIIISAEPE